MNSKEEMLREQRLFLQQRLFLLFMQISTVQIDKILHISLYTQ